MSSYKSLAIVSALGISGSVLCYYYSKNQNKNNLEIQNRTVTFEHLTDFLNQGLFVGLVLGYAYTGTPFFYSFLFNKNK